MTHPILSMLPDEATALHFEGDIADFSRRLSIEKKKAELVGLMSVLLDIKDLALDKALRATAPSKASSASTLRHSSRSLRIHRGEPRMPTQW